VPKSAALYTLREGKSFRAMAPQKFDSGLARRFPRVCLLVYSHLRTFLSLDNTPGQAVA
jgi:hypothetical protein